MVVEPIEWLWKDTTCYSTTIVDGKKVAPICQQDWAVCPGGWALFNEHCYLLVRVSRTWADAEKDCYNKGGHLPSVHSADENTFIRNLVPPTSWLWIGGTDEAVEVGCTIYICPSILYKFKATLKKADFILGSLNTNYVLKENSTKIDHHI
jgi:hypothetical protein